MAPPRPQPISHTPIRPRAVCRESGPWSASHSPASMFPSAYPRVKGRSHDALFVFPNCTKCVLSRPAFPSQRPRAVRTCRPCILRRRRLGAGPFQRLFSPPLFVDSSSMRSQCAADHPTTAATCDTALHHQLCDSNSAYIHDSHRRYSRETQEVESPGAHRRERP